MEGVRTAWWRVWFTRRVYKQTRVVPSSSLRNSGDRYLLSVEITKQGFQHVTGMMINYRQCSAYKAKTFKLLLV